MNKFASFCRLRRILDFRPLSTKLTADGKEIPKRKFYEERVTLISPDNSLSIVSLKDAQSLSIRRELKLVKIQDEDSKTRRPIYKLMTNAEYHEEELSRRKEKQVTRDNNALKGEKLLTLSSRIAEHDVMTAVKKMKKLLEKHYTVKIIISGEENESQNYERIFATIDKNTKSFGKVVQKRSKGNSLRFHLVPLHYSTQNDTQSNNSSSHNGNEKAPL